MLKQFRIALMASAAHQATLAVAKRQSSDDANLAIALWLGRMVEAIQQRIDGTRR